MGRDRYGGSHAVSIYHCCSRLTALQRWENWLHGVSAWIYQWIFSLGWSDLKCKMKHDLIESCQPGIHLIHFSGSFFSPPNFSFGPNHSLLRIEPTWVHTESPTNCAASRMSLYKSQLSHIVDAGNVKHYLWKVWGLFKYSSKVSVLLCYSSICCVGPYDR